MESFREFKDFKSDWKPKKRIPVVRTVIALALIYAVYASGAVQKAYQHRSACGFSRFHC